ncbi:MAG: ABC transporter, partial [Planctomycetota bacterium]
GIFLDGTLDQLRRRVSGERRLIVDLAEANGEVTDPAAQLVSRQARRVTLAFDPHHTPPAELIARITARHQVRDLFVEDPPIEEIIARLYGQAKA